MALRLVGQPIRRGRAGTTDESGDREDREHVGQRREQLNGHADVPDRRTLQRHRERGPVPEDERGDEGHC